MKQITLLLAACIFCATTASAQFFHRKNAPVEKQATPAKVKIKAEKKAEVKKAEPVVQEEMVPVNPQKPERKGEPQLVETDWYLLDAMGNALNLHGGASPYIRLDNRHRTMVGNTGCNSMGGKFKSDKHLQIHFEPTITRRACDDMSNEKYLLDALTEANTYMVNGDHLLLYHDDLLLATFEAR